MGIVVTGKPCNIEFVGENTNEGIDLPRFSHNVLGLFIFTEIREPATVVRTF